MRKNPRVTDLAKTAGLQIDDVLLELWNVGIEELLDGQSVIPKEKLNLARSTLGFRNVKQEQTITYWLNLTDSSFSEFKVLIEELGFEISESARRLPKNSLRKLRLKYQASSVQETIPPPSEDIRKHEPFTMPTIGTPRHIAFLSEDAVEEIHTILTIEFRHSNDPVFPVGVKSRNLLSSAVNRPRFEHEEHRKYPTIEMAAAALFHAIINDHPFHNGNKRTALVAMLTMLDINGKVLTCRKDELFREAALTAQHSLIDRNYPELSDREMTEIAQWISSHLGDIKVGDHPMKWGELKRRLLTLGCEIETTKGFNNQVTISRPLNGSHSRRTRRPNLLSITMPNHDSGSEIHSQAIQHIRKTLQLDESHGCDSNSFYRTSELVDIYIVENRRILNRLAKI